MRGYREGESAAAGEGAGGSFIQFQLDLAVEPEPGGDSTGGSTG